MDDLGSLAGRAVVVQPEEGPTYWQPVPANGFAHVKLAPPETGDERFALGFQHIAPQGRVRAHSHEAQVEILVCFRGRGRVVVDGADHAFRPGTTCFFGPRVRHEIVNDTGEELVMLWLIAPPGLEQFFAAIGRPRRPGEPAPAPFPRRADVLAVEQAMGFRDVKPEP